MTFGEKVQMMNHGIDSDKADNGRQIATAILIGQCLSRLTIDLDAWVVPISDLAEQLCAFGVGIWFHLIIVAILLWKGMSRKLLLICAVNMLIAWLGRYSAVGAFQLFRFLSVVFLISLYNLEFRRIQHYAAIALSILFVFSGLQKINALYLSGYEFTSPEGFAGIYIYHLGPVPEYLATRILPGLSIFVEIGIALGLLWRRALFAHVATLFILILSIPHPPVFGVYFTMLFFVVLIDSEWISATLSGRPGVLYRNPFFWAVVTASFSWTLNQFGAAKLYFPVLVTCIALLFAIHAKRAWGLCRGIFVDESVWGSMKFPPLRSEAFTVGVLCVFVCSFFAFKLGAPVPVGFSMFSAQHRSGPQYILRLENQSICRELKRRLVLYSYTSAGMTLTAGGCELWTPTASGRHSVVRRLCKANPATEFHFISPTEVVGDRRNCAEVDWHSNLLQ